MDSRQQDPSPENRITIDLAAFIAWIRLAPHPPLSATDRRKFYSRVIAAPCMRRRRPGSAGVVGRLRGGGGTPRHAVRRGWGLTSRTHDMICKKRTLGRLAHNCKAFITDTHQPVMARPSVHGSATRRGSKHNASVGLCPTGYLS